MSYLICLVLSSLAARGPIVPNPLVTACEVMFPNGTFNLNFTAGQVEAMPINVDLEPLWGKTLIICAQSHVLNLVPLIFRRSP